MSNFSKANKQALSGHANRFAPFAVLLLVFAVAWISGKDVHAASGLRVATHTQGEIRQKRKSLGIQTDAATVYSKEPVNTAPYDCGSVSDQTLQNGVNILNYIRYIAGIPANVQIKAEYQELAQAAALITCVNGYLSHRPVRPSGMAQDLYDRCYEGANSSNLSMGYGNLYQAIAEGWMEDGDFFNIDRVGHRRWCLNPTMQYTGFGIHGKFYAMYVFDGVFEDSAYSGVAWPAQNMPVDLFGAYFPWSISVGTEVDPSSVSVHLKRVRDGKEWSFSDASAQGYFNVNNDNYGQPGCIIFRPEIDQYVAGDSFDVTISSSSFNASYTVNFFDDKATTGTEIEDTPPGDMETDETEIGNKETGDRESGDKATEQPTSAFSWFVRLSKSSYTYNGKSRKPAVTVRDGKKKLTLNKDFTVKYKNNKNAGIASVVIIGKGDYKASGSATKHFTIKKATQVLKVSVSTKSVTVGKTIRIKVAKAKGKVSYKSNNKKYATISSSGKIKGVKAGKVTITVKAAGDKNHKPASKKFTITVKKKAR